VIAQGDSTPHQDAETSELFAALQVAIGSELSPHQREVLVAVTLSDGPIDVLCTTRGSLYETIHDARRKLRAALTARGLGVGDHPEPAES
jgi:RNA polymerase sigma-70 factor, ECF subfamily